MKHLLARPHYSVDLGRTTARPGVVALLALALGAAALAWAGMQAAGAWARRDAADLRLQRVSTAIDRDQRQQRAVRAPARPADAAETLRLRRELQRVAADLHRPWLGLFEALEAQDATGVRLQQFSVDPRFAQLTLQVQARELGAVLRYVKTFDTAAEPLAPARLIAHEWVERQAGGDSGAPATAPAARVLQARIQVPLGPQARHGGAGSPAMKDVQGPVRPAPRRNVLALGELPCGPDGFAAALDGRGPAGTSRDASSTGRVAAPGATMAAPASRQAGADAARPDRPTPAALQTCAAREVQR